MLRIRWPDKISNEELLHTVETTKASKIIIQKRWRWIGHILRRDNNMICTTALTWQPEVKRNV
jgi:hypothetical protein